MKDIFTGALGRTNHHGGSRCFTTPNTVRLPPDYFINFNINRNFVTCSLDGRLWAYGSGTTYVLFALKWNEENSMLEQSAYLNFRGEKIKARGLDWVITDKSLIYVSDDEPYINFETLFDGSGRFLYSILRSSILDSSAWGKGYDGNSEGWGFFNKNNIPVMELCYSSLPPIGDWYVIPNFLVRKNYGNSYNSMRLLRPLIPLEFNNNANPSYGTGYSNRNIQLGHRDNMIFARGVHHIGRCYLLPAVFNENGETEEFYLYISPDYVFNNPDDNWLNLTPIASKNGSLYGFLTEKSDSLSNDLCLPSSQNKAFIVKDSKWREFQGAIFLDCINSSAIAIHDAGINLFLDDVLDLQCNTLLQWVAPSGNVSCISDDIICSQSDEAMLVTNFTRQFYRNITDTKHLPLSAVTYQTQEGLHIRASLGETNGTRKNISVNHFVSPEIKPSINWDDIYRQAVSIKLLSTSEQSFEDIFYINGSPAFSSGLKANISRIINREYQVNIDVPVNEVNVGKGAASDGYIKFTDIVHSIFVDLFVFNPDTGDFEKNHFSHTYENILPSFTGSDSWLNDEPFPYVYWPVGQKLYWPTTDLTVQNGSIGFFSRYSECVEGNIYLIDSKPEFIPLATVQAIVPSTWLAGSNGLSIKLLSLPNGLLNGCASAVYAVFSEKYTNTNFALYLPSLLTVDANSNKSGFFSDANSFTFYEYYKDNTTLHLVLNDSKDKIAVLRSEVFYDIFNFYDELQRSRLS